VEYVDGGRSGLNWKTATKGKMQFCISHGQMNWKQG
jgi:hypothetical protein